MLLGEPPRTQYDLNFSLFGITVRVHPFFWLVGAFLGARSPDLTGLLVWVAVLFVAILVHELGHALAMLAYGFLPSITLYGMGGLTSANRARSFRSASPNALGSIVISAAGPVAGFVFAACIIGAILLSGRQVAVVQGGSFGASILIEQIGSLASHQFVHGLLFVSIIWGAVNLLPVYPLDGGQISREVFLQVSPRDGIRQSLMLSAVTATCLVVIAVVQWRELFVALLFGYLAYSSYATLRAYSGRGPGAWG